MIFHHKKLTLTSSFIVLRSQSVSFPTLLPVGIPLSPPKDADPDRPLLTVAAETNRVLTGLEHKQTILQDKNSQKKNYEIYY